MRASNRSAVVIRLAFSSTASRSENGFWEILVYSLNGASKPAASEPLPCARRPPRARLCRSASSVCSIADTWRPESAAVWPTSFAKILALSCASVALDTSWNARPTGPTHSS